jgi:MarR family transcriptional regulator for hemolysin
VAAGRAADSPTAAHPGATGYDREQSAGYLVTLASRLFANMLRDRLADMQVTPAQVPIILWLHERDGLTQKDLCERARIEQPSAAEMLARMERLGLVSRTRDPDDGRRFRYHLTEMARAQVAALEADAMAGNAVALAGVPADEAATFLSVLRRVIANLKDADRPGDTSSADRKAVA